MSDPVEDGARAAAQRLMPQHGQSLAVDVEAALYTRGAETRREQFIDPVSLGSLIVSVATLSWTIYQDRKARGAAPPTEVIVRAVRIELDDAGQLKPTEHEQLIETTVEETTEAARRQENGQT